MEKIIWVDSYSVGIKEMDKHHQHIIQIINTIIEEKDGDDSFESITNALTELTVYSKNHLEREEQLMLDHKYPDYPKQIKEHNYFREKIANLCFDLIEDTGSIPAEVLNFLKEWFINHIINVDMRYKLFFKEKGLV